MQDRRPWWYVAWLIPGLVLLAYVSLSSPRRHASPTPAPPVIDVWHGVRQKVGHLGNAQSDFNLLGNVSAGVRSLIWSLNGTAPRSLRIGTRQDGFGDSRRLAGTGDFNADMPIQHLHPGDNHITLTATDGQGQQTTVLVTVERLVGTAPLPLHVAWHNVGDPQNVGQYVDGQWGMDGQGLRTLRTGYDRMFLLGEAHWQDYEITVPVTIHRVDARTGPASGRNGVGLLMRFTGHVIGGHRHFPAAQPKWGYQPFGAIGWLRWGQGGEHTPLLQFYRGDRDTTKNFGTVYVHSGQTIWMKMRATTLPDESRGDGVTRYSWKWWRYGTAEPRHWTWDVTQSSPQALRRGGVALLAHHVDATFGDITIIPLPTHNASLGDGAGCTVAMP